MVLYSLLLSALLVVQCDSYLVDTPRNVVVMTGASVTLPCKTSGGQSITWLAQDGSVISTGTTVTVPSKYSVNNSESGRYNLVIRSATFGLGGTYQCQQTGDASSRYYAEVTVLNGTPRITSNGPDGNNIVLKETVELTCSVPCQGNMLPQIKWSYYGDTYDSSRSIYNATRSTSSSLTQNTLYVTYTDTPENSKQPFSCLVFFDRVKATDSVHATNAPSYIPVQLSYTLNVQVPIGGARVSAYGSVIYINSAIGCSSSALNSNGYYRERNISPAPTYSWQVSTSSTDLHFGPNSKDYLKITRDMIGRTTFTCTASNTIRGVTYSATSDPVSVFVVASSSKMSAQAQVTFVAVALSALIISLRL